MTRAQPKVAAYPFTTLVPVLGTIDADDRQLVLADIPGLIEGAHDGAGLGHDFLAHVERTRLLVHVLDLAPLDGSDPEHNFEVIERELAEHDPRLAGLPRLLALSKADLVTPEVAAEAAAEWRERVAFPVLVTSSATGDRPRRAARRAARARAGRAAGARGLGRGRRRRVRGLPARQDADVRHHPRPGRRLDRLRRRRRSPDPALGPRERGGAGSWSSSGCGGWA